MTGIEYDDFLNREYEPDSTDLVCTFSIDPAEDMSMEAAASRVASESSNGTWAALHVDEDELTHLGAVACGMDGNEITVAYPAELFEVGSMPQILSCIAGNIMGMKAVDAIRLEDCEWPKSITSGFPGPQFGTSVAREKLDAGDRPILATVPKPKVGLSTDAHVRVGEEAWRGGVDLLKDDENLTDQDFNPFEDRLAESLAARDRVEEDVGERKDYLVNVTAETNEMLERVDLVAEHGGGFVMVDIITCGWSAVQSVRDRCQDHGLAIHAHRAMHAAFDRMDHHGVSMRVIAQISRLCGVDHIHTGTAGLGKLANEDTPGINDWLHGDCHGLNPVLPVASGGLHPGVVDRLIDALGTDICIQAGGGIHGHPDGTHAGAKALRQATDASLEGVPLEEYAQDHAELATALDKWGAETPR
ncbi:ribulose bisophosphate carboxylase [Natrialba chahannaoensis JCM 10990]|uniref:Ribulose bisphosphate carboxylase n=1 Tax=Natrialba chahannaoensis JCM 10990 TaxID=1227492 RepID=M0AJ29_9EURY|nr:type III ribulose-bisphosphate carboxylase [Natrialba chahannaoensis]ELY98720.1 ribulose bisophosphate carboxylase [Natrialba chahannaoensis JCM 10990]